MSKIIILISALGIILLGLNGIYKLININPTLDATLLLVFSTVNVIFLIRILMKNNSKKPTNQ